MNTKKEAMGGGEQNNQPGGSGEVSSCVLWHRRCLLSGAVLHRWMQRAHTEDGNKDLSQSLE